MVVHQTGMQLSVPAPVEIKALRLRAGRSTRRFLRIVLVFGLAVVIFLINVQPAAAHAPDWRVGVGGMLVNPSSIDAKWLCYWVHGVVWMWVR